VRRVAIASALAWLLAAPAFAVEYYPPLSAYVDTSSLPADVLAPTAEDDPATPDEDEGDALRHVRVKEFLYSEIKNAANVDIGARLKGTFFVEKDVELALPGLSSLLLVVARGEIPFEVEAREEADPAGPSWPFSVRVGPVPVRLRVRGDTLRPLERKPDGTLVELPRNAAGEPVDAAGNRVYADLGQTAVLIVRRTWDGEAEIELEDPAGGIPSFAFVRPVMIGDSGIVLDVQGARVDLSDTSSPPPRDADPAWRGVTFERLSVEMTRGFSLPPLNAGPGAQPSRPEVASIEVTNFSVGTGGLSGRISGSVVGELVTSLGGMQLELTSVDIQLEQNALVGGAIGGVLRRVPFFERDVKVNLALDLGGDFKIAVAADDPSRNAGGILVWDIDDVLDLEIRALTFERKEDVFLMRIDGTIVPRFFATGAVEPDKPEDARIDVNGLTISSTGEVSLAGGWVDLPAKRYLNFHAFRVELAQVGFGAESGGAKWIGFSGGIELVKGLPARAAFEKLTFSWPRTDGTPGVDVALSGVEVGFRKPGVVSFAGSVDWFDEAGSKGFAGSIAANLEFIQTTVAGRLVIGKKTPAIAPATTGTCATSAVTDPFKFFYIDFEATLPSGIPVFSNVSLYGISGLFAHNLEPNLCAFERPLLWLKSHREATNPVGGAPPPWVPRDDAAAFGAGVVLGTTSDDGYAINAKVALTVALPGPLVLLTGAGNIIEKKPDLSTSTDPLFDAIAVYDGRKSTFLLNLGVYYKVPSGGEVIDLSATGEAFFNLDDPGEWHLWLGKKTPDSARISAKILKFFTADAYWMLGRTSSPSARGRVIRRRPSGSSVRSRCGSARRSASTRRCRGGRSTSGARPELRGEAELSAWGFGVGVGVRATLAAKTPTPYLVDGDFEVKLKLPWPLPDPKAHVHLHWEQSQPKQPLSQLVTAMAFEPSRGGGGVVAGVDRATTITAGATVPLSTFCAPWESLPEGAVEGPLPPPSCTGRPLVEVDDVPVVASVAAPTRASPAPTSRRSWETPAATVDVVDDTSFAYHLRSLKIWSAPKSTGSAVTFAAPLKKVYGAWPALTGDPAQPAALYVKLWSRNPFAIYEGSTRPWVKGFGTRYPNYPCQRGKAALLPRPTSTPGGRADPAAVPRLRARGGERCGRRRDGGEELPRRDLVPHRGCAARARPLRPRDRPRGRPSPALPPATTSACASTPPSSISSTPGRRAPTSCSTSRPISGSTSRSSTTPRRRCATRRATWSRSACAGDTPPTTWAHAPTRNGSISSRRTASRSNPAHDDVVYGRPAWPGGAAAGQALPGAGLVLRSAPRRRTIASPTPSGSRRTRCGASRIGSRAGLRNSPS
jgi:hypothetical protein